MYGVLFPISEQSNISYCLLELLMPESLLMSGISAVQFAEFRSIVLQ